MEKQKTIKKEFTLSGIGLHTGSQAQVTFRPAPENHGVCFVRVDLPGKPVIRADTEHVRILPEVPRCTTIGSDGAMIHTVEHLLSTLSALGIDNLLVEINANELPGLDGSAMDYLKAIKKSGIVEQNALRKFFEIKETIGIESSGSSLFIVPSKDFKISYTLDYDHPVLGTQFLDLTVGADTFEQEIAPCRTFCLESEAKELKSLGLGQGANFSNTLVVGQKGVIDNKLRFPDEFVRHKVLDLIGDLYLLGVPIRGHIFAVKSGHTLNLQLLKKINEYKLHQEKKWSAKPPQENFAGKTVYDIQDIMNILPHRYPFLFVDRVVIIDPGKKGIGFKNVTMNDYFFQGHFPTRPIMPGVLMVEAMAQAAGVVVLTNEEHRNQLAFFLAADEVKFRKVVTPGDQLIMEVEVMRDRSKTTQIYVKTKVNEEIVSEAKLVFSFTEITYLD